MKLLLLLLLLLLTANRFAYLRIYLDLHNHKGPVTLCNFLSNLSRNGIAIQVAGELHSVAWVV